MSEDNKSTYRPMKYPYTLSAKMAQFPIRYYFKHSWFFKYWIIGSLFTIPVIYKIQKLANSPENVAKWKKLDEELFKGTSHH